MPQNYDVFMLNRVVKFRHQDDALNLSHESARDQCLQLVNPTDRMLRELPGMLKRCPQLNDVWVFSDDLESLWMTFCSHYHEVAAAGGVVLDRMGHVLWIQRNGKWDLPKGKLEPGETLDHAAIREVEEETGITQISISGEAVKTFHTYEANGVLHLKTTFWFPMKHDGDQTEGIPQAIEGITDVTWLRPPFPKDVLSLTFGSIRVVLSELIS